jgi:hypothetical protein
MPSLASPIKTICDQPVVKVLAPPDSWLKSRKGHVIPNVGLAVPCLAERFSALPLQGEDGFRDDGHVVGLIRVLRKICQDFGRAMLRSRGARVWVSARLTVRWVVVGLYAGWSFEAGRNVRADAGVGALGRDGDALAFVDADDLVGVGAVGSWEQPSWVCEIHSL